MRQFDGLFYRSGPAATVTVMENPDGVRFLSVDGKTDASTSQDHDMKTQVMLGQLPLLVHSRARSVFLVGLGSAVMAGSVLTHPVEPLTCAESSYGRRSGGRPVHRGQPGRPGGSAVSPPAPRCS